MLRNGDTCKNASSTACALSALPEVPLFIQDRMFDTAGQLYYPVNDVPRDEVLPDGPTPPYWVPGKQLQCTACRSCSGNARRACPPAPCSAELDQGALRFVPLQSSLET